MGKVLKDRHNATCATCHENYSEDVNRKTGKNTLGKYDENKVCSTCRDAQSASGNRRMNKHTWRSLVQIDASWGHVKQGELWEQAVAKFAESIPVREEQQEALKKALLNE